MNALVGYTGFVGSNLYQKGNFDSVYNSKNIKEAYGSRPDLLIYAGLRAEKYLANHATEKDMEQILQAEENIRNISPEKLVLISTIDVFKKPDGVNESTEIDTEGLQPYGFNRYQLELWVRENYPDALIVRLPGLYGKNIKKNFIYDYINIIPFMLKQEKLEQLSACSSELKAYYQIQNNGYFKVKELDQFDKEKLKNIYKKIGFSALNFTDSRSVYQFYPLERLWQDIQIVLEHNIKLWHPATEPVSAGELYEYLTGNKFINELSGVPAYYDYRTEYGHIFANDGPYIMSKQELLLSIKEFVDQESRRS